LFSRLETSETRSETGLDRYKKMHTKYKQYELLRVDILEYVIALEKPDNRCF